MDYGGMPIRPPQGNGNGTPGMQQGRVPGMVPMGTPGGPVPMQQQQQSMLQLSAPAGGRPRPQPHASMTPGVRLLNVQRFPGGPINQRRVLMPQTQQGQPIPQHLQQQQHLQLQMMQQPREGETPPPPPAASPPAYSKQHLMQPVHLQLPPSGTPAGAGMVRRPAPITGTPHPQGRQMRPGGMTAQQQYLHQQQILQKHRLQQEQRAAAAAAAAAGRPLQQQQQAAAAAGTPQQHHQRTAAGGQRIPAGGSSAPRAAGSANGQPQQQSPRYNRQQMQQIMKTMGVALENVRKLRSAVHSSYLGGAPTTSASDDPSALPSIVDAPLPVPVLSAEQLAKRIEKFKEARVVLDQLHESLRHLPSSTLPMFGGREQHLADMMDTEDVWDPESGQSVGEEVERVLMGEELRSSYFGSVLECMSKMPMVRHLKGTGLKEGLNAHSSFLLCLTKLQTNRRLQQQRNLKIRLLNSGPRDTRFEMCITTPHQIHPTTTLVRVVITVCDGCLARATFLGPNELVDSSAEERSVHLVYRQMSVNASDALLSTAKGRHMSLMSSIHSIFTFLQQYPACLQSACCECGKCLRDFLPPTRFVNLSPLKFAHPECHQPDR